MWWKIAAGAVVGLILGSFVPPGYAVWVVIGIVGGYLVDALAERRKEKQVSQGR